jgi:glycine/sarcosine N-methyltransferase
MYDAFSADYDRFVNWTSRLEYELPFIEQQLGALGGVGRPVRVLDTACGTGMHALALAQKGYKTAGADLSPGMVERARANAAATGVKVRFAAAGFGALAKTFSGEEIFPFDALLCMGNSLPHVLTLQDLALALTDFARCLRPGGLVLIQNRNFDAILAKRERWMEPQSYQEGDNEWIFLRFYDYELDGLINFNFVTLRRLAGGDWQQHAAAAFLYPVKQVELIAALKATGFEGITCYGDMAGAGFDPATSGNLIVAARLK